MIRFWLLLPYLEMLFKYLIGSFGRRRERLTNKWEDDRSNKKIENTNIEEKDTEPEDEEENNKAKIKNWRKWTDSPQQTL